MAYQTETWPGEPPTVLASTSTHEILNPPSNGSLTKSKRNRNALSCAECRRLKLKCSRTPWPCTNCVKRKCAHICPDDVLKEIRPSRSKEVGALQERIHALERQLEAALTTKSSADPNFAGQLASNFPSSISTPNTINDASGGDAYNKPVQEERHPGISDVAEVMGTLLLGEDGSSRYLGKSAANALFHEENSSEDEASGGTDSEGEDLIDETSSRLQGTAFPFVSRGLEVRDFQAMLPPLSEARVLADAYYHNCAYMFEPLKRAMFENHLAAAYELRTDVHPITLEQLALVFMVFALGVLFDLDSDPRDPRTSKYHNISQACLTSAKFLNIPSLASIQCLHMMSTWHLTLHSQTGAFRAWPLLGLAGRMVLSTGLHRDGSIWAIPEPDLTIRRALFWEIVCYDRLQGMILGRPYMINSRQFDTAMPTRDPLNPDEDVLTAHRAKWEFSLIVGDLCDDCFSIGRPGYDTILRHDRRIRTFKEALPQWLRFDPSAEPPAEPYKQESPELRRLLQQHTIAVQVHETLLFLHRVAFAQAIEHYPQEPLRSPWAQSVVSLCLEASRTLIAVARSAYHCYPKLAARWWHIQVHAFGAGVCFAAVCIKAPASALSRLAWTELCDAVTLLESTSNEGLHAKELYPRLRKLREQAHAKLEAYHLQPQTGYPGSTEDSTTPQNQLTAHLQMSQNQRDQSPEGEKLAVLGTATRKLEGNFRPHNAARSQSTGGAGTSSERTSDSNGPGSQTGIQSSKNSPLSQPAQTPQSINSGGSNSVYISPRYSTFAQPGNVRMGSPAYNNTNGPNSNSSSSSIEAMQTYENLDPGLAQLLASISNTPARETSAMFPPIERNYGLAQPSNSTDPTKPSQLGNVGQTAVGNNSMSFDMTGASLTSHLPPPLNPDLRIPVSSPAPTNYTSPGREFFGGRQGDNGDVIEPFASALSPPPPGAPGDDAPFEIPWMDYFQTPGVGLFENANTTGNMMMGGMGGMSMGQAGMYSMQSGQPQQQDPSQQPDNGMGQQSMLQQQQQPMYGMSARYGNPSQHSGFRVYDELLSSLNNPPSAYSKYPGRM